MRDSVLGLAKTKLSSTFMSGWFGDQETPELAVLAIRLLIELDPSNVAARPVHARLVEMHMATAYSVPRHGKYMWVGYPSEPLLAEAAACGSRC
jgi:hypothetical protein